MSREQLAKDMLMLDVSVNSIDEVAGVLNALLPVTSFFRFGQRMTNLLGASMLIRAAHQAKVKILYDGVFSGNAEEMAGIANLIATLQPYAFLRLRSHEGCSGKQGAVESFCCPCFGLSIPVCRNGPRCRL